MNRARRRFILFCFRQGKYSIFSLAQEYFLLINDESIWLSSYFFHKSVSFTSCNMNFKLTWLTSENNTFILLLKINISVPLALILISKKRLTPLVLLEPSCLLNIHFFNNDCILYFKINVMYII